MTLAIFADGVANEGNLTRIDDAARLLNGSRTVEISGRLIAVENTPGAVSIYGRRPLRGDATLAVGNERRGVSRRVLSLATEVIQIPTLSRTVNTLNVAAAAAVAGWYVVRGSPPQRLATNPEIRRPSLFIVGTDHVEVGSSLRSAAALGYRDILLGDRGAGWFDGGAAVRREAFAAARRHKNAIRAHPFELRESARFDEIIVVLPSGDAPPLQRLHLARGPGQLVIVGASRGEAENIPNEHVRIASLGFAPDGKVPLRLAASVVIAEIARQVGRRQKPTTRRPAPTPRYKAAISLVPSGVVLVIDETMLLDY